MVEKNTAQSLSNMFPSYHPIGSIKISEMWDHAHFVLDTNVLLNFYRYSISTRDELIQIMDRLKDRVWIPHHAALEFEKRRLSVIADQKNMFSKVKNVVSSGISGIEKSIDGFQLEKRHSTINASSFLKSLRETRDNFISELEKIEANQLDVYEADRLYSDLNNLFSGCVGAPYDDQTQLDKISADREKRNKSKRPPGFRDRSKEHDDDNEFYFNGLRYLRIDGDIIIWSQIKDFARSESIKSVIFITDDRKDDWWHIIDSNGKKTVGPRPELIEEIYQTTNGTKFWMYRPDCFLAYAREHLRIDVAESTVSEVRNLMQIRQANNTDMLDQRHIRDAVSAWIRSKFDTYDLHATRNDDSIIFDFIYIDRSNDGRLLINIIYLQRLQSARKAAIVIGNSLRKIHVFRDDSDRGLLVCVVDNIEMAHSIHRAAASGISEYLEHTQVWLGVCEPSNQENELFFIPVVYFNDPDLELYTR
ncbi:MAG: PIN-like domain-containing protein [Geminicoccaceae bacterium]